MIRRLFPTVSLFIFVLLLGLVLRLLLSPTAIHVDLYSNAAWGRWIYDNGARGFFQNTVWTYSWPTQPPLVDLLYSFSNTIYSQLLLLFATVGGLIATHHLGAGHLLWLYRFVAWFASAKYQDTPFTTGYFISIKLIAIVADCAIAAIIYALGKRQSVKRGLIWAALFLFLPLSWYISALWGQYDSVSFVFLLISFLLLYKRYNAVAAVSLAVSILIKPTSLIFVPLFIVLYFMNRPRILTILLSFLLICSVFVATTLPFAYNGFFQFVQHDLHDKIFFKAEFKVTNNAFNLWYVLFGNQPTDQNIAVLFIPAKWWGYAVFAVLNIWSIWLVRRRTIANWLFALMLIGIGSWLFMTNMLDRYWYAGIVFSLAASLYNRKLLPYWLIMTIIFSLNLYNQWWIPMWLDWLKTALLWHDHVIARLLSATNIFLFLAIVSVIAKTDPISLALMKATIRHFLTDRKINLPKMQNSKQTSQE